MTGAIFVTGTDTEIGKTFVSCLLLRAASRLGYRALPFKPVASGGVGDDNPDVDALREASGCELPAAEIAPYTFAPPIAPHLAAREAGVEIDLRKLGKRFRRLRDDADLLVVEGVGGWAVPLSESAMLSDLVRGLDLPVILTVPIQLGCLNHALLSARAITADGLRLFGWIANCPAPNDRSPALIDTLTSKLAPSRLLAVVRQDDGPDSVLPLIHELIDPRRGQLV